jgi:tetratricopeptide (TPR) repeat protein
VWLNGPADLDPLWLVVKANLGRVLSLAKRHDEAISYLSDTVDLDPGDVIVQYHLAEAHFAAGNHEQAVVEYQRALQLSGGRSLVVKGDLASALALTGRREEALVIVRELEDLSRHQYVAPYPIAGIYVCLAEKELAFEWLEKAYEARDTNLGLIKVDPTVDPLRDDPRFQDLLRRMNFPD